MSMFPHILTREELAKAVDEARYALREARLDLNEYDRIESCKPNCGMSEELDNNKRCTTCKYDKSETKAACVDCVCEAGGADINPTNWTPITTTVEEDAV